MTGVPTAQELEKLPLRAIAAFAARAARRVEPELHGVIEDEILREALAIVENVASGETIDLPRPRLALVAAARVVEAAVPLDTRERHVAALAINSSALVAYAVLSGMSDPSKLRYYAEYAAREAERAARRAARLGETVSLAATEGARADYETLLRLFGEHQTVVVGDPVDLSARSPLGALMQGSQSGDAGRS